MVLSDRDIRSELAANRLRIEPLDDSDIQPASVDLRLGSKLLLFEGQSQPLIDVKDPMSYFTRTVEIDEERPFELGPGEFVLGMTLEYVELPDDLVGRLDGKSSLGRLGLVVHSTAGFVDPGWKGNLTLELSNLAALPIRLYYGMKASQISLIRLSSPAERPYGSKGLGSKYQGQRVPTASRFFQDYPQAIGRHRRTTQTKLRKWLTESEFRGNVGLFAEHLGVKRKTVEDWVYGRRHPSRRFISLVYEATALSEYHPRVYAGTSSRESSMAQLSLLGQEASSP